jgi:hypothetical protein
LALRFQDSRWARVLARRRVIEANLAAQEKDNV